MRSIARCVLPVLVGPRTARTRPVSGCLAERWDKALFQDEDEVEFEVPRWLVSGLSGGSNRIGGTAVNRPAHSSKEGTKGARRPDTSSQAARKAP